MKTLLVLLAACAALAGCASNPKDPLEPFNRAAFDFNEKVDNAVAKPVAKAYVAITPSPVRAGLTNFINNLGDVTSSANCLLQAKGQCAAENFMRFGMNSVFGIFGILDIASEAGIARTREDFGQTLGRWGVPTGPYIMMPIAGPTTLRDLAASRIDAVKAIDPLKDLNEPNGKRALGVIGSVNSRANSLGRLDLLGDIALDRYTFVRDAFMQKRRNDTYDGRPPEEDEEPKKKSQLTSEPAVAERSDETHPLFAHEAAPVRNASQIALSQSAKNAALNR
jgi:phospholipid-binding lipoprotein MlaA